MVLCLSHYKYNQDSVNICLYLYLHVIITQSTKMHQYNTSTICFMYIKFYIIICIVYFIDNFSHIIVFYRFKVLNASFVIL